MERVETLKMAIDMSKADVQELSDSYLPGVDSDSLGKVIVNLKKQVQMLEDLCNRF
jgi:hypothetical protein